MSPSSSISSPILGFFLRLTKFAGQNKVPILEWLLAWTTVVVFGLRYLIDYARLRWKIYKIAKNVVNSAASATKLGQLQTGEPCHDDPTLSSPSLCDYVSLCPLAHTRKELSVVVEDRWERLRHVLFLASSIIDNGHGGGHEKKDMNNSNTISGTHEDMSGEAALEPSSRIAEMTEEWTDEDWIQIFRSNLNIRREASYLMFALSGGQQQQQHSSSSSPPRTASIVLSKFRRLWPKFLELPRSVVDGIREVAFNRSSNNDNHSNNTDPAYHISLIVPMYKERITDIGATLNQAFGNCRGDPKKIQVVVVHAESSPIEGNSGNYLLRQQLLLQHEQQQQQQNRQQQAPDQHDVTNEEPSVWGELKVVTIPFGEGGGRGKTLNVGAGQATAPILTFLHADTMVPLGWDENIKRALSLFSSSSETADEGYFPHACAFTMAIDDHKESSSHTTTNSSLSPLSQSQPLPTSSSSKSEPPGLLGAEWLGVLRCHCGLPYGDSVLSFSRSMFDYMGGYPEQPLMEDYEVMDWLRLRSILLSTIYRMTTTKRRNKDIGMVRGEGLVLLRDRAKCSPRRWKKYGVAYTSLVNAICIFRYHGKATAEDLFDFYYHCNSSATSKTNQQK
jgi:hypothetical protein